MKRILAAILALIMLTALAACSGGNDLPQTNGNAGAGQENTSDENTSDESTSDESGKSKATEYTFELAAEEERTVKDLVFDEDVTVSGDFGIIIFENCEFNGDVINAADQFTRVCFVGDTTINGNCVFKNSVKEGTMDTPLPKFVVSQTVNVIAEDCIGSCVQNNPDANVVFNGETYTLSDAEYFWDTETNGVVPYEGQEATILFVGQWWENGEKFMFIECEA